jgi:hypothetical protein
LRAQIGIHRRSNLTSGPSVVDDVAAVSETVKRAAHRRRRERDAEQRAADGRPEKRVQRQEQGNEVAAE